MAAEGCWPCFPQPLGQKLMQRLCGWWNDQQGLGLGGRQSLWLCPQWRCGEGPGVWHLPPQRLGGPSASGVQMG